MASSNTINHPITPAQITDNAQEQLNRRLQQSRLRQLLQDEAFRNIIQTRLQNAPSTTIRLIVDIYGLLEARSAVLKANELIVCSMDHSLDVLTDLGLYTAFQDLFPYQNSNLPILPRITLPRSSSDTAIATSSPEPLPIPPPAFSCNELQYPDSRLPQSEQPASGQNISTTSPIYTHTASSSITALDTIEQGS